eukprot:gene15257-21341_t
MTKTQQLVLFCLGLTSALDQRCRPCSEAQGGRFSTLDDLILHAVLKRPGSQDQSRVPGSSGSGNDRKRQRKDTGSLTSCCVYAIRRDGPSRTTKPLDPQAVARAQALKICLKCWPNGTNGKDRCPPCPNQR